MADATAPNARSDSSRRRRVMAGVGLSLVVALAAAGCGSSKSSTSATTGGSSATTGSSGTSASGGSGGLAAAQAATAGAEKTPTAILQTTPLTSKPPTGKTAVFIQDDISQSVVIGQGEVAGLEKAGWHVKILNWLSSNPTTLVTAMQQALQYHPVAVSFAGAPQAVWGSEIPAYAAAHVAIIPSVVGPQTITGPVKANIADFTSSGVGLGNWFISDSKGQGHALLVDLPVYPILTQVITGAKQAIAANCPDCKTTAFNGTLQELSSQSFVSSVVSALRKDPSIKYVLSSDLLFITGLSSALSAAGLSGIKIAGAQPEPADFTAIQNGTEAATVVNSNTLTGWTIADAVLRLAEGMTIPPLDGGEPYQLETKANVAIGATTEPADYQSRFLALWHLG